MRPLGLPLTDGTVTIRPPGPADRAVLVGGRDDESRRWLGEGTDDPRPTAVVEVDGRVVGWVDADEVEWLGSGEVNLGYALFAPARGRGHATRAVRLLLEHLAADPAVELATVSIDPANTASLRVAARAGFVDAGRGSRGRFLTRTVSGPPGAPPPAARPAGW